LPVIAALFVRQAVVERERDVIRPGTMLSVDEERKVERRRLRDRDRRAQAAGVRAVHQRSSFVSYGDADGQIGFLDR